MKTFQQKNSSKYDAVIRAINMSMLRCDIPVFKYTKNEYCTILLINQKQPFDTHNRKKD